MATATYTPLATYTVTGSPDSTVSFASIPSGYRDLIIVVNAKSNRTSFDQDGMFIRLNNDSSNHQRVTMLGRSTGTLSDTASSLGVPLGGNAASLMPIIIHIMDYSATDKHKTVLVRANSNAPSVSGVVAIVAGRWASTSAVTSVVLLPEVGPEFVVGSTFSLYGIAG